MDRVNMNIQYYELIDEALNVSVDGTTYYKNFPINEYEYNLIPGSMPVPELFIDLINQINPTIIIEIGSYWGYSAICMGNELKKHKNDFRIICIDTWLGNENFYIWGKEKYTTPSRDQKQLKNGYPTTYYQFVRNIIQNDLQNHIIPIPLPSKNAAVVLKEKIKSIIEIKADLIYIDGSHEEMDVYYDCKNYWDLLKINGIMFGDDWTWNTVKSGVSTFAEENKLQIQLHPNGVHWFIRKI